MFQIINSLLWAITTVLMLVSGIYFSIKLKFPQLNIKKIYEALRFKPKTNITPIETLYLTLAGRIGVGSIAGVALALYIGGKGTIFWMWITAIITGSLAYTETLIGLKYQKKTKAENLGGPAYYIKNGVKKPKLAFIYSFILIIAYFIGFIPIQSNTIVKSLNTNSFLIKIILFLLTLIIINGGLKKIIKVTNKLVPLMMIIYISLALFTIIMNIGQIIPLLCQIIKDAFHIKSFFTSFIPIILVGVQRSIFSNESGIGLGAIATTATDNLNPSKTSYVQVFSIYITTFLICTATAFIVLLNQNNINIANPNGIEITLVAFKYHFHNFGQIFLIISIILFSFTTILTGFYYCYSNLKYIIPSINDKVVKFLISISVLFGTIITSTIIWNWIDLLVALLAIINIYGLLKLRLEIIKYNKKYDKI